MLMSPSLSPSMLVSAFPRMFTLRMSPVGFCSPMQTGSNSPEGPRIAGTAETS